MTSRSMVCVFALLVGCSSDNGGDGGSDGAAGSGGSAGDGGSGGTGGMTGQEFPCTEQGIRDAIAEGGGPYTFECDGPTTVVTEAEVLIDNDVILDGEGRLTVDAGGKHAEPLDNHRVFSVPDGATVELHGLTITKGFTRVSANLDDAGAGVRNEGVLTLVDSTVSGNGFQTMVGAAGDGIANIGDMTIVRSTITSNVGAIWNSGTLTLISSTVSGDNIANSGMLTLRNSTMLGLLFDRQGTVIMANTLLVGQCEGVVGDRGLEVISLGYNIHSGVIGSEGECTLDQSTDQFIASEVEHVPAAALRLGPLQDNGGPTMTHALLSGSVAIDVIPEGDCVDADSEPLTSDQRGVSRPQGAMCDVGAFEVQEGSL